MKSELYVITKAKELCTYILTITEKSPKKYRFTLVSRMQNLSLNVVEYLFRANDVYIGDKDNTEAICIRQHWQKKAVTDLRLLDYIAMVSEEQNCILKRQYEQISKLSTEVLAMTIKWKNGKPNANQ